MRRIATGLTTALLLLLVAIPDAATAQRKSTKLPKYKIDPYTKNKPKLIAKLGYVSYGPFSFGQRGSAEVTTTEIEKKLSYVQLIWVETPHFKIGMTVDPWAVPFDPKTRAKIRAELGQLKENGLPKVNPKTRRLDRWLRLHLVAMRMENIYAEFQDWLGVTDASFPQRTEDVIVGQGEYMGQGTYLGQTDKYLVLVFQSTRTHNDYLKSFTGRNSEYGQRWNFKIPGSLFYGVSTDGKTGDLKHDTGLHKNLAYNITANMLDGYRFYSYDLPVWIRVGIPHWFARKVSPKWNVFDQNEGSAMSDDKRWRWQPVVRKLVSSRKYTRFSEAYAMRDYGELDPNDHIVNWSRWDFLASQGKPKFAAFMKLVKGRVHAKDWTPDDSDLVGATRDALQQVYGLSPLTIDAKWATWVKENYPAR